MIAALLLAAALSALRVCADPDNLPFSDREGRGLENALAKVLAKDLGVPVETVWWPQRRGFLRNTLRAGRCDVVLGVPSSLEPLLTTRPYYRSSWVFVTRKDRRDVASFDDPALRGMKIGVPVVADDDATAPPAHALASRGMAANLVGFPVYRGTGDARPIERLVHAVASGEVDVALAWGPAAGWAARRERVPLRLTPVSPRIDLPFLPFVYDIAVAVRRGDTALRDLLDGSLQRRRAEVDALLASYGVPRVP